MKRTPMKRKAIRRVRMKQSVRDLILGGACVYGGYHESYPCNGGMTIDHVIPVALRRRHHIAHDDPRYLVPSCISHNLRKGTRRFAPMGFDLSTLPGTGWQHWSGGKLPEVVR